MEILVAEDPVKSSVGLLSEMLRRSKTLPPKLRICAKAASVSRPDESNNLAGNFETVGTTLNPANAAPSGGPVTTNPPNRDGHRAVAIESRCPLMRRLENRHGQGHIGAFQPAAFIRLHGTCETAGGKMGRGRNGFICRPARTRRRANTYLYSNPRRMLWGAGNTRHLDAEYDLAAITNGSTDLTTPGD